MLRIVSAAFAVLLIGGCAEYGVDVDKDDDTTTDGGGGTGDQCPAPTTCPLPTTCPECQVCEKPKFDPCACFNFNKEEEQYFVTGNHEQDDTNVGYCLEQMLKEAGLCSPSESGYHVKFYCEDPDCRGRWRSQKVWVHSCGEGQSN